MNASPCIDELIEELRKLPSIGPKSAQRLAFHILKQDRDEVYRLIEALKKSKDGIRFCSVCHNYSQDELCEVCSHPARDKSIICVVSEPKDIPAIENTSSFHGVYHVLGGEISPLDGIGPDDLNISDLIVRISDSKVREIIIATNPDAQGESTAAYLNKLIEPLCIQVTRPASGLPVGGNLEFADEITLSRALTNRTKM
ncbi:MAG: recombination protein RecR [Eggerthellaceae bacterium]|nr:recombination protein RecR [Eggerthellaceae bacterium]